MKDIQAWPDGAARRRYSLEESLEVSVQILERWQPIDALAVAVGGSPWRRHAAPLYAFARQANAFADNPVYEGVRTDKLDAWDALLERAYHGTAEHPLFIGLAHTVRARNIPITPLKDLMLSFRHDVVMRRPAMFRELLMHCRLSAGSIGRIVMHLAGEVDPFVFQRIEDLAVGLRLVDIVSDLGKDIERGRHYVPEEDLRTFDIALSPEQWRLPEANRRDFIDFQLARARTWLARGRPVLRSVQPSQRSVIELLCAQAQARITEIDNGNRDPFAVAH